MSTEVSKEIFEQASEDNREVRVSATFTDGSGTEVGGYDDWLEPDVQKFTSMPTTGRGDTLDRYMDDDYIERFRKDNISEQEAIERAWEELNHDTTKKYLVLNVDKLNAQSSLGTLAGRLEDLLTAQERNLIGTLAEAGFDFSDLRDQLDL